VTADGSMQPAEDIWAPPRLDGTLRELAQQLALALHQLHARGMMRVLIHLSVPDPAARAPTPHTISSVAVVVVAINITRLAVVVVVVAGVEPL
jgi:hypothetical protein